MGKPSQRRPIRRQENKIGCMWGLIRMFYSRRDHLKFILDRKQGSRKNTFSGFAGRMHSRKKSRDFEEIDEDGDNMEECSAMKPTVKRLMEGELTKVKQSKKIPNDEVQRILADLGQDVCLDKSSMQNSKPMGVKKYNASMTMASPSGSMDPSGSKCMKHAEEDDLELALSDFLGQIYKYHDENPHDDCRNKSELCPEMKSLIHTKLDEFNRHCHLAEQTPESKEKEFVDEKHICSSRSDQSEKLTDALEMLRLHNELFFKTHQKSNAHTSDNIQKHQNRQVGRKTGTVKDIKNSDQHELAIETKSKETRNIFFWKKDTSSRRHISEGSSQPVNKIVILKPNPRRGFDPVVDSTSTCSHQQSCITQAPEYSSTETSKFSIKEVRRRFRIVTGEPSKGPSLYGDDLQRDQHWKKDSLFTIKKDSRQVAEQMSAQRSSATAKNNVRPSNISNQQQRNDGLEGINNNTNTSKDASIFYEEAKKHLTDILNERSQNAGYPAIQISRSLVGLLSLPQCSTSSSPRCSPRVKDCIDISPEEKNICAIHKAEREEYAKESSKSEEASRSVACGISQALDKQAVQERRFMKEQAIQHGAELDAVCIEEIDKRDLSETICIAQCTPTEQHRCNSVLGTMEGAEPCTEDIEMFPCSPENVLEKSEQQEPKTPRPTSSLELISQITAEENHEKQEQPSPVSVLDPFLHEDVNSPESDNVTKCELHQDILRPQYSLDAGSDQGIFWEDNDVRLGYIKEVLELSELCTYQNLEVWYLEDELISPCLFEELYQGNQTDDLKLLFDCICEAITVIQGAYFRNIPCLCFLRHNIQTPPMGHNLILEINKHIEVHLYCEYPTTLNQLVSMDLEDGTWMNLRSESEEIVVDIWELILDELLEDATYDCLV